MRLFSSIALLALACTAYAQKEDSVKQAKPVKQPDTVKISYLPTGIRFGTDLVSLLKSRKDATFHGWEVNADIDFYKYFLAFDYGASGRNETSDVRQYASDGHYYRIGGDVNILTKDPDRNMVFFGFRYAQSSFSETLTTTITDPLWGTKEQVNYANPDARAHWIEITGGLRVKIWHALWMGYTCRYKFSMKASNTTGMVPADVPGYGRNAGATWGFNYQLFWRIPVRKIKSGPPKK